MKEREIRPQALLDRYLELSLRDAESCFGNVARTPISCVASGEAESSHQIDKFGFSYALCENCGTLFQNPRPDIAAFEAFYRQSESSRYWAEEFFPAVAEVRREKIFRPRVDRLAGMCEEKDLVVTRLVDVGAGYGIFLDEWRRRYPEVSALAVEPSASLSDVCRSAGFDVVEDLVENLTEYDGSADLVTCFEVLEHAYAPLDFVQALTRLVRPDGYVFLSSLGIDGFDLQVLWDQSSQIFPPHHINFMSVKGFECLFQRAGLIDITVQTPGQLDVDIVRNAAEKDPSLLTNQRFIRNLVANTDSATAFQRFLVEQRLSSHVWVMGRRPSTLRGVQ